jgi:uncharacterized repeat protein (TIGR03809 family)
MSARQPGPYDTIATKWLALAERRAAHLLELRDSGRWKYYYTEAALIQAMDDALDARERWMQLVDRLLLQGAEAAT